MSELIEDDAFRDCTRLLMADASFCAGLDALAVDVFQTCEGFLTPERQAVLRTAGFAPDQAANVLALVVGWVLGFHEDAGATRDQRIEETRRRVYIAAVAAGTSAGVTAEFHERSRS